MKKLIKTIWLLAALLFLLPKCNVLAAETTEKHMITEVYHASYEDLSNLPSVQVIQNDTNDSRTLMEFFMTLRNVSANVQFTDGSEETLSLRVKWDVSIALDQTIDFSTLGTYYAKGEILLPDDSYEFGNEVSSSLTVPVEVIVPKEPFVITMFDDISSINEAYAFETECSLEEVLYVTTDLIDCYDTDGNTYPCKMKWNTNDLDLSKAGVYSLVGTPTLPMHAVADESLKFYETIITISIQEPQKPDINCMMPSRGYYSFPWVTPPGDLDKISAWLSKDNGDWEQISENNMLVSPGNLRLRTSLLEPGFTYKLQVDYEGGQTGILSFHIEDEFIIESYNYGDRDGGDVEVLPPVSDEEPSTPDLPQNEIIVDKDTVTSVKTEKQEDGSYKVTVIENGDVKEEAITYDEPDDSTSDTTDIVKKQDIPAEESSEDSSISVSVVAASLSAVAVLSILLFFYFKRRTRL